MSLQRSGTRTATELAHELEVSVRTIYRDIRALQEAGAPVWTETGPGGGIHLMPGWRSPVDGMTGEEASALMLGPSGAADLGMASVLANARSKVRSGLPASVGGQIDAIAERFHVDAQGWFRQRDPGAHLPVVAGAVWDGVRLDIRYAVGGRVRTRRLDPLGLVLKAGVWYLVAAHRGQIRTYRVQRIEHAALRDEPVTRPGDFRIAEYWSHAAEELDRRIRPLVAVVRVPGSSLAALRIHVPGPLTAQAIADVIPDHHESHRTAQGPAGDHGVTLQLPVESIDVATAQLAAVSGIEVLEPAELRESLRALGTALARSNA